MRQYELAIRIAQVHHLVGERKYKKALAVIQTLDMRQVRSLSDLKVFAEVYIKTEQYEAAKATYLRIYRRSHTRRVLYRLIYLSIRTNALEDAEAYYREFVRMNPNVRDSLILRYRIDKASGAPIGQLIDILQELKQEEYIEEWAYELAKLYHRAGRREECREECEDILLWFGTGEIVERAKLLIEHLEARDPMPYYDDKDFTIPKKEEPNPEDTGSLPDLNEYMKERKAQKKEERRQAKEAEREAVYEEEYDDQLLEKTERRGGQTDYTEKKKLAAAEDEFIDDYEEDDFEQDGMDLSKKAIDGIQKLSGLLKLGKKEEEPNPGKKTKEGKREKEEEYHHSQSGTGITQDLAKEIAAIYEMEHKEQLKEKAVTVINEAPNRTSNVVERMTQAIQKSASRTYIPLDVEEIQREVSFVPKKEKITTEAVQGKEMEHFEEKEKDVLEEKQKETADSPEGIRKKDADLLQKLLEEELEAKIAAMEAAKAEQEAEEARKKEETADREKAELQTEEPEMEELTAEEEPETEELVAEGEPETEELAAEEEPEPEELAEEEPEPEELAAEEPEPEELTAEEEPEPEELAEEEEPEPEELAEEEPEPEELAEEEKLEPEELAAGEEPESEELAEEEEEPEPEELAVEEEAVTAEPSLMVLEPEKSEITEPEWEQTSSNLENYTAPDIPVVETEYMEMPEITYDDLPTTRALHRSFQDILTLIRGELDPSHFVLIGDGDERIIGVAKQIVRVMKESGYLSQGRIAKIRAGQLNKMDLVQFKNQLKGNCLLIEEAADLLFPTITKLFSMMDEYYGDVVVIFSDEGNTLDQLFRFIPALAMKFKYVIDISEYTQKDYE